MVITFVTDVFSNRTNGTVITAIRFKEQLEVLGHEVRVVAIGISGEKMYGVNERKIPIISSLGRKQKMLFAKPDKDIFRQAFEGSDIIHFFMPWKFAKVGLKIATKMNIPVSSAFHVAPENLLYGARLNKVPFLTKLIYRIFRNSFYNHFDNIHCPSHFIANELKKHKYTAKLHVISNGVKDCFFKDESIARDKENFHILSIGRFAPEKKQDVTIKAIAKSKHRDRIIIHFAGSGPLEAKYIALAEKLNVKADFGFYNQEELIAAIRKCHLYIHAAEIEIEGMSCIEALSCGRVPIISNSKKAATGQFALNSDSLFETAIAPIWRRK